MAWTSTLSGGSACVPRATVMMEEDFGSFWRIALTSLPDDPSRCLLQMRSALRQAVNAGSTHLMINIQVPALDAASRGFDARLLAKHGIALAEECAAASGSKSAASAADAQPLLLVHSLAAALETIRAGGAFEVIPLGAGVGSSTSMGATEAIERADRPVVIIGPFGDDPEDDLSRRARAIAPLVVLLNHWPTEISTSPQAGGLGALARRALESVRRPDMLPSLTPPFEVAFELLPLVLQSAPVRGDLDSAGVVVAAKAVLCRRWASPWSLLVDPDGAGYVEVRRFKSRPRSATLQDAIRTAAGLTTSGTDGGARGMETSSLSTSTSASTSTSTSTSRSKSTSTSTSTNNLSDDSVGLPVSIVARQW
eukprot:CAMPEP_0174698938 /NCGR_PEP_ID=MMETSP1094-20130205/4379_1 /TAXON_ID=156173 /ORGANISM="Chrysochromulina brevifilum, Strain UTEX LB 985" /LENGTH=366 /DNA_ID=CAMNT_0015896185 /DNA_START=64 /DNA_END=1161 /DNA_ORIENTATION=+